MVNHHCAYYYYHLFAIAAILINAYNQHIFFSQTNKKLKLLQLYLMSPVNTMHLRN